MDDFSDTTSVESSASSNLSELLESLDVDGDCDLTRSIANNGETSSWQKGERGNIGSPDECFPSRQSRTWGERLKREEIYSLKYSPSKTEQEELLKLEKCLEVQHTTGGLFGFVMLDTFVAKQKLVWDELVHPSVPQQQPCSILIKRGLCWWIEEKGTDSEPLEIELVLLSRGLVLASVCRQMECVKRQFSRAIRWSDIDYVQPDHLGKDESSWQLLFSDRCGSPEYVWTFTCGTAKQRDKWLKAVAKMILRNHLHHGSRTDLGWQYRYVHVPAFSMAVTNRIDVVRPPLRSLSKLDKYCGYSPLHYAVRSHNEDAVRALLKVGCDPNQPSKNSGLTPMDYAVQDNASGTIVDMLKAKGGLIREHISLRGELFGQVRAVEARKVREAEETCQRETDERRQAEVTRRQMNENILSLEKRGEQIQELASKASELNDGAKDFSNMAKQLKGKSKATSRWFPF